MKTQIIGSLSQMRNHYSQLDKHGVKFVALNLEDSGEFTTKGYSEQIMSRITGLDYNVSSDTKFLYRSKTYGSLYQKLDFKRSVIEYTNMVG